jgi:drug/metabolite transporter (DMT)-like permease
VGYTAFVYALKYLPVSTVSLYAYVNPVIAVVLGSLLLGEPFGPRVVIASAMVLVGIAVVRGGPAHPSFAIRDSWFVTSRRTHKSQVANHK